MAVSADGFRAIYFQGHPEYDANSLLKEYKREVLRWIQGELQKPPPLPQHYLSPECQDLAEKFVQAALQAAAEGRACPDILESQVEPLLDNTWADTAKALFNNWLGLVYQLTNLDRRQQYMPGTDKNDPLGLRKGNTQ